MFEARSEYVPLPFRGVVIIMTLVCFDRKVRKRNDKRHFLDVCPSVFRSPS